MDVIGVGVAVQLGVGLVVWWLRLRWQACTEQRRGWLAFHLAAQLRGCGGRVREWRADGSVLEVSVVSAR